MSDLTAAVARTGKPRGSQLRRLTYHSFIPGESLTVADAPHIRAVPINQFGSVRLRSLLTGGTYTLGAVFARLHKEDGVQNAQIVAYGAFDQPAIDGTATITGEQSLEITSTEHQGEEFLLITVGTLSADLVVEFFDITGSAP